MKILYHHRIASKDGQYVHVEEIIKAMRELGHDVIIVAPDVAEQSDFGSDGGWVDLLKAKLPKGDWLWPAIWMLPRYNEYGQWPASGEIDIMESRGNVNYPK